MWGAMMMGVLKLGGGIIAVLMAQRMLPIEQAAAQKSGVDTEGIADGGEGKQFDTVRLTHNPSFGVGVKPPGPQRTRECTFLVNVDGISQEGEHQALFAGQPIAA
jgi:hypothetical protein